MRNIKKNKTPIFCTKCKKESGYFLEDFINDKVKSKKFCNNCKDEVLDSPDFPEPLYN